jgi:hypothetical protein
MSIHCRTIVRGKANQEWAKRHTGKLDERTRAVDIDSAAVLESEISESGQIFRDDGCGGARKDAAGGFELSGAFIKRRLLANRIRIAASIRDKVGISGVGSRSGGNLCTPLFSRAFLSQLIPSP